MDPHPPAPPSAHADPEGEAPWAMQLVVHVPKVDAPSRTEVLEAAATATVRLLADERAGEGGEWHPAVTRWWAGRIRKHTRRARGARWEAATEVPGVTVTVGGATVHACVPTSTDAIPAAVAKLQLSGWHLEDPAPNRCVEVAAGGPVVVSLMACTRIRRVHGPSRASGPGRTR